MAEGIKDCAQHIFQQSFDHVDNLSALEMCIGFIIGLRISEYLN